MGLRQEIASTHLSKLTVAYRPPQLYLLAGSPYTIFTIAGGPVWILALFAHTIEAVPAGTRFTITVNGVPVDVGATVITSLINRLIICPLDDTAALAIVPNVAASNVAASDFMLLAATGNINLAVTVANTNGLMDWYCAYYRMNPSASIIAP